MQEDLAPSEALDDVINIKRQVTYHFIFISMGREPSRALGIIFIKFGK